MTNLLSLSSYLTEFSQHRERPSGSREKRRTLDEASDSGTAEQLQQSYERGVAEGRSSMKKEMEAMLAKEREAVAISIAEQRNEWVGSQSAVLCSDLETGLRRVEDSISNTVASILRPFLEERVRIMALQEFGNAVKDLLGRREAGTVKIRGRGPADLVERFSNMDFCPELSGAEFEVGSAEMTLSISETLVETRMNAWIDRLRQVD